MRCDPALHLYVHRLGQDFTCCSGAPPCQRTAAQTTQTCCPPLSCAAAVLLSRLRLRSRAPAMHYTWRGLPFPNLAAAVQQNAMWWEEQGEDGGALRARENRGRIVAAAGERKSHRVEKQSRRMGAENWHLFFRHQIPSSDGGGCSLRLRRRRKSGWAEGQSGQELLYPECRAARAATGIAEERATQGLCWKKLRAKRLGFWDWHGWPLAKQACRRRGMGSFWRKARCGSKLSSRLRGGKGQGGARSSSRQCLGSEGSFAGPPAPAAASHQRAYLQQLAAAAKRPPRLTWQHGVLGDGAHRLGGARDQVAHAARSRRGRGT